MKESQPATPQDQSLRPLVHGHDERIHLDDLEFGSRFVYDLIVAFCTPTV